MINYNIFNSFSNHLSNTDKIVIKILLTILLITEIVKIFRQAKSKPYENEMEKSDEKNEVSDKEQGFEYNLNCNVLAIADTHGCLKENDIKQLQNVEYDICVLLGDISLRELMQIKNYVDISKTVGIMGNHYGANDLSTVGIKCIHGTMEEINGIKIAGWGGSIKYKNSIDVAFTDEESEVFATGLKNSDILISHDSPKYAHSESYAHSGMSGITKYMLSNEAKINIHGHHHVNEKKNKDGINMICVYGAVLINKNGEIKEIIKL